MKKRLKYDLLLTGGILLSAFALWGLLRLFRDTGSYVTVEEDGKELGRFPLSEDSEHTFLYEDGEYNVLIIKNGEASVTEASCRDQVCVSHAPVSQAGESIICLPHRFTVTVYGEEP